MSNVWKMQVEPLRTWTKEENFDDEELCCHDVVCAKGEKCLNGKLYMCWDSDHSDPRRTIEEINIDTIMECIHMERAGM